jgi:hypothetical protein
MTHQTIPAELLQIHFIYRHQMKERYNKNLLTIMITTNQNQMEMVAIQELITTVITKNKMIVLNSKTVLIAQYQVSAVASSTQNALAMIMCQRASRQWLAQIRRVCV